MVEGIGYLAYMTFPNLLYARSKLEGLGHLGRGEGARILAAYPGAFRKGHLTSQKALREDTGKLL